MKFNNVHDKQVVTVAQAVKPQGKRSGHNHYVSNYGGAYSCL
jgi:hypothetical protein